LQGASKGLQRGFIGASFIAIIEIDKD